MCVMPLKAELHCHNVFSNGNVGALEPIYDCNVTISKQLEQAHAIGLDVLLLLIIILLMGTNRCLNIKKIIRNLMH